MEKFLQLSLWIGLFGKLFGLGKALPVNFFRPVPGVFVSRVQKNRSKNGFPDVGERSGRFMDFFPRGIGPDTKKGREAQFASQFGERMAIG